MTYETVISKAAKKAAQELTPLLKLKATLAGWPSYIINEISIDEEDDVLFVDYPDHYARQIEDLEYGTQKTAPNAVLRTFLNHYQNEVSDFSENVIVDGFAELGGLA